MYYEVFGFPNLMLLQTCTCTHTCTHSTDLSIGLTPTRDWKEISNKYMKKEKTNSS